MLHEPAPAAAPARTSASPPRLLAGAAIGVALAGPAAIGVLRGVLPYDTVDEPIVLVEKIMAAPGAQTLVLWLAYLALLTLPLGVAMAGWLAARSRPVLGSIAAVFAWLGFLSLFAAHGVDATALAAAGAGVPAETVVALETAAGAIPVLALPGTVFVIGHILGAVLLAVALRGVIPTWAAVALGVSQPLHLVFVVLLPNHVLDAVAWSLTGVGFAAAAAVLVRRRPSVVTA
ncbi:hypothetical protein ACVGOW_18130 [Pseudonocardia saturnea]